MDPPFLRLGSLIGLFTAIALSAILIGQEEEILKKAPTEQDWIGWWIAHQPDGDILYVNVKTQNRASSFFSGEGSNQIDKGEWIFEGNRIVLNWENGYKDILVLTAGQYLYYSFPPDATPDVASGGGIMARRLQKERIGSLQVEGGVEVSTSATSDGNIPRPPNRSEYVGFWEEVSSRGDPSFLFMKRGGKAARATPGRRNTDVVTGNWMIDGENAYIVWDGGSRDLITKTEDGYTLRGSVGSGREINTRFKRADASTTRDYFNLSDGPAATAEDFIGYWSMKDQQGGTYYIEVGHWSQATRHIETEENRISKESGRWTMLSNGVHITWEDGTQDTLRITPQGIKVSTFSPGAPITGIPLSEIPAELTATESFEEFEDQVAEKLRGKRRVELAQKKAVEEAKRKAEEVAKRKIEEEARARTLAEARRQAEEEARRRAEDDARIKARELAQQKDAAEKERLAEERARRKAEELERKRALVEEKRKAKEEAQRKAEEEARRLAELETQRKAEEEARKLAELKAQRKAEEEARRMAELEVQRKAEEEARRTAELEAQRKAEEEARRTAELEAQRKAEEEARRMAELEAQRKAEEEARRLAELEAQRKAEEEARRLAELEAQRKTEEEARSLAELEAQRKAEEKTRRLAELEAQRKAEEEARRLAEMSIQEKAKEEARRLAELEAQRKAEQEVRRLAELEAQRKAEEEARRLAELEAQRKAEQEARRLAELEAQREAEQEARQLAEAEVRKQPQPSAPGHLPVIPATPKVVGSRISAGAEIWQVQDTDGDPFKIVLNPDGTALSTWAKSLAGRKGQKGVWKQVKSGTQIDWSEGGTYVIASTKKGYKLRAYSSSNTKGTTGRPVSDAEKTDASSVVLWDVVFEDAFDGPTIDETKWNTRLPWTQIINNEQGGYSPENASIVDGHLVLTAADDSITYGGEELDYTTGAINTYNNFEQAYGYFEIRAKVPEGRGLWPAFWLFTRNGPPEIDVLDVLSGEPDKAHFNSIYLEPGGGTGKQSASHKGIDFSRSFRTVGMEWSPSGIIYYIEGKEVARFTDHIPDQPMFLVASLAVGGDWPGPVSGWTAFPARMEIDFIRVYKRRL